MQSIFTGDHRNAAIVEPRAASSPALTKSR
jgi:hypothetical protein